MERHVPMDGRKGIVGGLLAIVAATLCGNAAATDEASYLSAMGQTSGQTSQPEGSSSSQKTHRKTARHTTVAEEDGPPPELTKAEGFIQKQDFAQAELLLR